MKRSWIALLALAAMVLVSFTACGGAPAAPAGPGARSITDMAGRTLEVPAEISKAFASQPVAAIYLYTLAPQKLLGWNYELNELESRYMEQTYKTLPVYGMNEAVNHEAVIAAGPQIALTAAPLNEAGIANAEALEDKLGIPVVLVSERLEDTAAVYRFLGDLLGEQERGAALADYVDKTFADVASMAVPSGERLAVYYGNGPDSLETAPPGTIHSQIIDMVGGFNVAEVELEDSSRVHITLEQVIAWNPDVIVVNGEPKQDLSGRRAAESILEDPDWASVDAVQGGRVYGAPKAPFSWVDRPAGPNRVVGIRWLANLLYPEYYSYDTAAEVREFYRLFYHTELSDAQMEILFSD